MPAPSCLCGGCARCRRRARNLRWKRENPDKVRAASKRYYAEHREEQKAESLRRYHAAEDKTKYLARAAVNRAIARGKMERGACEVCGAPNAHAHHEDYSKPLEVKWLCKMHHGEAHRIPLPEVAQ